MNLDEYRAMKAEQENEQSQGGNADAQTQSTATESIQTEQVQGTEKDSASEQETSTSQNSQADEQTKVDEKPNTIEIDGKEVPIDELKNGYLRQSDYTKKTQEIKRKEQQIEEAIKFMEEVQKNPQVAEQLSEQFQMPNLDPKQAQVKDLEDKYYDLLIQSELRALHDKYGEFDESEVLNIVMKENIENLDTAFHVMKSRKGGGQETQTQTNPDELKQQLRQEILAELKKEQPVDTSTIIQSNGGGSPIQDTTPQLSAQEQKVAKMMGLGAEEYAKWRDAKSKR
jgi:hypothetical protein